MQSENENDFWKYATYVLGGIFLLSMLPPARPITKKVLNQYLSNLQKQKKQMSKLEIVKENVLKAYRETSNDGKNLLSNLFGKKLFSDPMSRIKTYNDAAVEMNTTLIAINHMRLPKHGKAIEAYQKLIIIAEALNEGWEPNWNNPNERKWYPWFDMSPGFGFSVSFYSFTYSGTTVGSRLCFKSEELANYAGKQFEDIYRDFLTL